MQALNHLDKLLFYVVILYRLKIKSGAPKNLLAWNFQRAHNISPGSASGLFRRHHMSSRQHYLEDKRIQMLSANLG